VKKTLEQLQRRKPRSATRSEARAGRLATDGEEAHWALADGGQQINAQLLVLLLLG